MVVLLGSEGCGFHMIRVGQVAMGFEIVISCLVLPL